MPAERQRELAGDAVAIVNNHYDTDGVCALFAVRHPELALPRAEALLRAARAGDFYQAPDEAALIVDAIVGGFADAERSPIADQLQGLPDLARYDLATQALLERLPAILDGEVESYRELWLPIVERYRADLADLATCARDDIAHLDLTVWTAPAGASSSGARGAGARNESAESELFDPSRHALFGSTPADRVLVIAPTQAGTTYRLVVGTRSWFELVDHQPTPRPPVKPLAARLNALEPATAGGPDLAWRTQGALGASPELWFGRSELESFSEHNPSLAPSALPRERVRREVADAVRAVLVLH